MNKPRVLRLLAFLCLLTCGIDAAKAQLEQIIAQRPPSVVADPAKIIVFQANGLSKGDKVAHPLDNGLLRWTSGSTNILRFLENTSTAIAEKPGPVNIRVEDLATHKIFDAFNLTIAPLPPMPIKAVELAQDLTVTMGVPQQMIAFGVTDAGHVPLAAEQIESWTSSDSKLAIISKTGIVTAIKSGSEKVTITVNSTLTMPDGKNKLPAATTMITVADPPPVQPRIGSKLIAGSKTVTILADGGDTISIYQFDPGFNPGTECSTDLSRATLLSIVNSPTVNKPTITLPVANPPDPPYTPQIITVTQPLIAGTGLCILDRPVSSPTSEAWSSLQFVPDPDDYGRVRTYFIAGVQVSNQQAANASSTAGQYLEAGFNYSWIRAKDHSDYFHQSRFNRTPGLSTILDIRLSPIPVAAPATMTTTTTPAGSTQATTVVSSTPNMLTTQQSARVVGSVYFPLKATHWNKRSDYFTFAPLLRGGFATLLNPSIGSSTSSTGTTAPSSVLTTTTGAFNSAYSFVGYGARLGWDRYPASTDEAPQPIAQFLVTLGSYSNLPSYQCKTSTTQTTPNLTGSACGLAGSPFATSPVASRTLVPRLDIDGFIKLPNYPYVLGLDANLAQYSIFNRSNIDYLSKPGNDIRIYVGFKLDIGTIVSKLGVNSQ